MLFSAGEAGFGLERSFYWRNRNRRGRHYLAHRHNGNQCVELVTRLYTHCNHMSNHVRLLHTMRSALDGACIAEVSAAGEFILPSVRPILFPGAVYGFATQLSDDE